MVTVSDRDFLVALIDLKTSIINNDTELATTVKDTLNSMELADEAYKEVNHVMLIDNIPDFGMRDAYYMLLNELVHIEDREIRLKLFDVIETLHSGDKNRMNNFMDTEINENLDLSVFGFHSMYYAKIIISMCFASKRFDKMDIVRTKLLEV